MSRLLSGGAALIALFCGDVQSQVSFPDVGGGEWLPAAPWRGNVRGHWQIAWEYTQPEIRPKSLLRAADHMREERGHVLLPYLPGWSRYEDELRRHAGEGGRKSHHYHELMTVTVADLDEFYYSEESSGGWRRGERRGSTRQVLIKGGLEVHRHDVSNADARQFFFVRQTDAPLPSVWHVWQDWEDHANGLAYTIRHGTRTGERCWTVEAETLLTRLPLHVLMPPNAASCRAWLGGATNGLRAYTTTMFDRKGLPVKEWRSVWSLDGTPRQLVRRTWLPGTDTLYDERCFFVLDREERPASVPDVLSIARYPFAKFEMDDWRDESNSGPHAPIIDVRKGIDGDAQEYLPVRVESLSGDGKRAHAEDQASEDPRDNRIQLEASPGIVGGDSLRVWPATEIVDLSSSKDATSVLTCAVINTSGHVLVLGEPQVSCGCLSIEGMPERLGPWETRVLRVTVARDKKAEVEVVVGWTSGSKAAGRERLRLEVRDPPALPPKPARGDGWR